MAETTLRIPGDADLNPETLELRLGKIAQSADLLYDGPESEGNWEVHTFGDIPPVALIELVKPALKRGKFSVTGEREVTWEPPSPPPWIWPTGGVYDGYDRAVRRVCNEVGADPDLSAWWKTTGHTRLDFQTASARHSNHPWSFWPNEDGSGQIFVAAKLDISILDGRKITPGPAREFARRNVAEVLDRTAAYLKRPRPRSPLLDE